MTQTLKMLGMVSNMTGRRPFVDEASYIKHINYCIGMALKNKLAEDKANKMKHQRNDLIKNKEGEK